MNNDRLRGYISSGIIIGSIINILLTLIIGVKDKEIYNYFISGICCLIPTIIICIMISLDLYKKRKIDMKKLIIISIIFSIISFVIGFFIEMLIINKLLNKHICEVSRIIGCLYQTSIGLFVSADTSYNMYIFLEQLQKK